MVGAVYRISEGICSNSDMVNDFTTSNIHGRAITSTIATTIDLRGIEVDPEAVWHLLAADSLETRNGFATPDAIRPHRRVVPAGGSFRLSLPPRSVSVISLRARRAREARP